LYGKRISTGIRRTLGNQDRRSRNEVEDVKTEELSLGVLELETGTKILSLLMTWTSQVIVFLGAQDRVFVVCWDFLTSF